MSDPVEAIGQIAASAIMLVILFLVLTTLAGADPSSVTAFASSAIELIVYLAIVGVFGVVIISIIKGVTP